ncbi:MAG: phage terminase large subunit [Halieaceae bacterium]|nr:phage terminase large subunit [Halieaceae bacterium]
MMELARQLESAWSSLSEAEQHEALRLVELIADEERADAISSNFLAFVEEFSDEPPPQRHHLFLIECLQRVFDGEIKRLMVFMPPGSAKSTYTSILFVAFWIQANARRLVIGASHGQELADRFGRKVRNIVGEAEYTDMFDVALADDSRAAGRWEATNASEYYAVGTGGSVTGRRGDLGLIDDGIKGREEADSESATEKLWQWYLSDFRTRLKPDAAIVNIQTRWSERDIAGRILPDDYAGQSGWVEAQDGELWFVVNLPMEAIEGDVLGREVGELLWPDWFTPEWVEQEKKTQGPRNWAALYQQNPTPMDGTQFKQADFQWYSRKPKERKVYITGDYAVTKDAGDFTEIGVWGVPPTDEPHLLDQFRGRVDALEVVETLINFAEAYDAGVVISESGVIRRAIEPLLKKRMKERGVFFKLEWLPTTGDKVAMCQGFAAMVQQGVIHFPKTPEAEELVSQLIKFPAGRWDDGVDMCGLLGRYMHKLWKARKKKPKPGPKELKGRRPIRMKTMQDMGAM